MKLSKLSGVLRRCWEGALTGGKANETESKGVDLMTNRSGTFSIYLLMVSIIAPLQGAHQGHPYMRRRRPKCA